MHYGYRTHSLSGEHPPVRPGRSSPGPQLHGFALAVRQVSLESAPEQDIRKFYAFLTL
jgi:hypothetical protein